MSCYEIGDGWASEWKAEIAGNLLPASSSTTLPTPSPSPSLLYRALIQTRFVNIDVCFALRGCKSSLPLVPSSCHPTGSVSLSIFCSNVALRPPRSKVGQAAATFLQLRGNRSWLDGSFSLARITGEVSLPGSRRVINSFGSPSHGRILSNPASTDTCYLPFRVGRGLMINSKDPDRIYTFVLVKFLARERKGLEMR